MEQEGLSVAALVVAAGSGERLGAEVPKAFVEVAGEPLVAHCLKAFAAAVGITEIVVAAPPGWEERMADVCAIHADCGKLAAPVRVVTGGKTRAASVAAALEQALTELVAVHDGARPLVSAALVDLVIARLRGREDADGAIAAAAVTDTIKQARGPRKAAGEPDEEALTVASTPDRGALWAAQTPQVFRTGRLREVLAADPERAAAATDEAQLIEEAGGTVLVEPAPAWNIKVTTAADLRVAEMLLAATR